MAVRHDCDNPGCVNPLHLRLGRDKENMQDKVERDRQAKGSENGRTKLTEKKVLNIRRAYQDGTQIPRLARKYLVCPRTIYKIVNRETWKQVSEEFAVGSGDHIGQ